MTNFNRIYTKTPIKQIALAVLLNVLQVAVILGVMSAALVKVVA